MTSTMTQVAPRPNRHGTDHGDTPRSRQELAAAANREHRLADLAAKDMIAHAIQAGEALLEAKATTPPGEWTAWLDLHFEASQETALVYMRLAYHRDAIQAAPELQSIAQARRYLQALGSVRERHGSQGNGVYVTESVREEARAMRRDGYELRAIAAALGYSVASVHYWCNPDADARRKVRHAAAKARRREVARQIERDQKAAEVRRRGGDIAEVYALIRRATQRLDAAIADQEDREVRRLLTAELGRLYKAEDGIVRALGIA